MSTLPAHHHPRDHILDLQHRHLLRRTRPGPGDEGQEIPVPDPRRVPPLGPVRARVGPEDGFASVQREEVELHARARGDVDGRGVVWPAAGRQDRVAEGHARGLADHGSQAGGLEDDVVEVREGFDRVGVGEGAWIDADEFGAEFCIDGGVAGEVEEDVGHEDGGGVVGGEEGIEELVADVVEVGVRAEELVGEDVALARGVIGSVFGRSSAAECCMVDELPHKILHRPHGSPELLIRYEDR